MVGIGGNLIFISIEKQETSVFYWCLFYVSASNMFYNSKISDSAICLYKVLDASTYISYEW